MIENNPAKWSPDEIKQYGQRGYRARRAGEFPPVSAIVRPDDYDNELKRGTLEFDPSWKNYAFHRALIPDGAVVRGCNFAQAWPGTQAIVAAGELTLIECNLTNCALDPRWKIENCNTTQGWRVREADENGAREKTQYLCEHPSLLKGDEQPPQNAVLSEPIVF